MIELIVHGAAGRMGRRVCALADVDERFELTAATGRSNSSAEPAAGVESPPDRADVVVDFSSDEGARQAAAIAAGANAALLVGTTGLTRQTLDVLDESARSRPVMIAPNTSRGVAVLNRLAAVAARGLGSGYEVDLVERHHRHKRDAPSGTALRLLETLRAAGVDVPPERVHSLRAGEIIGDHELEFTGPAERLRIAHAAGSRDVFALGALDAAAWLYRQPPGHYLIEQALGLG